MYKDDFKGSLLTALLTCKNNKRARYS